MSEMGVSDVGMNQNSDRENASIVSRGFVATILKSLSFGMIPVRDVTAAQVRGIADSWIGPGVSVCKKARPSVVRCM